MHGSLSWTADGRTLALITSGGPPDSGVRLLDTAAPGTSLLASSRLVVPTPTDPANWSDNYWRQVNRPVWGAEGEHPFTAPRTNVAGVAR